MPDWANELMEELMRPPYFLQHLYNEASGAHAAKTGNTNENREPGDKKASSHGNGTSDSASSGNGNGNGNGSGRHYSHSPSYTKTSMASGSGHNQKGSQGGKSGQKVKPDPEDFARSSSVHGPPLQSVPRNGEWADNKDIVNAGTTVPAPIGPTTDWQFVFKRSGFPISIPKGYGWTVKRVEQKYGIIRVQTTKGTYALKRGHLSPERLNFLRKAFQYVEQQGFTLFAPLQTSASGKPYVVRKNETYYATDWIAGQPANFASLGQVREVAHVLAQFHHTSRGFEYDGYSPPMEFKLDDLLRDRTEDLKALLARAQTRNEPDAFDRLLANHASALRNDAEESVRVVESTECLSFLRDDEDTPGLCHLDVIPGNFIYTPEQKVIAIDFDMCTYAPRALDLSHLLRRALQQQRWLTDVAYTCFVEYNQAEVISGPEYRLIYALLRFPYRVWRVAHSHYRIRKQDGQTEELELSVREMPRRHTFLDSFSRQIQS